MPRTKTAKRQPKLQEALVLFKYILSLFGYKDLEALSIGLKDPALEGIDEEGTSRIYYVLKARLYTGQGISEQQLYEYDRHIVRHTREINEKRTEKIQWKYYQYLALLFTEVYLDRYFSDPHALLQDINRFLTDDFNMCPETWHEMPEFTEEDLKKLAFWCATGSGKTLMMHINIKQYLYYAGKHHAKKLNRILILTPKEGLSNQHVQELIASNFHAGLFSKQGQKGFFSGKTIEVIDINKLAESDGDKTVAVDNFEGNNLVLVDEGHRGASGDAWKSYRNKLTAEGFSFEYSGTFGQAITSQSGSSRNALLEEYGKAILFDYSYRYFYNDGYGKDYRIMNMDSWDNEALFNMYLTAYLLSLYEQTLVYQNNPLVKKRFLIAKPLGIFVGGSVNAVRTVRNLQVSDVVQILLFLQAFIDRPAEFTNYIRRLFDINDGIKNRNGYSLFANSFTLAKQGLTPGEEEAFSRDTYRKVIRTLFHSEASNAHLRIEKLKGSDGEIGLRIGAADYFGVVNVGDSDSLIKLCVANGLVCETKEFGNKSLFDSVNKEDSSVNLLIGSKKFNEGWSSWRVSAMGLMNVGRSEGSEIIQIFGRGVRLKGFKYSMKRSTALDSSYSPGLLPKGLRDIETLNVFGVRADYMDTFRKYLEDEGCPANEDTYTPIQIPTVNLLGNKRLKVVRLKPDYDFKKQVVVKPEEYREKITVEVDWMPKVKAIYSKGVNMDDAASLPEGKLTDRHLAFIDWDKIFFSLQEMKNEHGWYNMELRQDALKVLMQAPDWYELYIQPADLEFHDFGRDVCRWQEIATALLRGYVEKAYKYCKGKEESKYMETVYTDASDPNFLNGYTVKVRDDKTEWLERLKTLRDQIIAGNFEADYEIYGTWIQALYFDHHLFYPLLCLKEKDSAGKTYWKDKDTNEPLIKISPVSLNTGETQFVQSVRRYYNAHKNDTLQGKEVYLLRNESRKGIGFFEANNFYPDFILWVNSQHKQHVTFIDPKGIRHLKGLNDDKIQLFKKLKEEIEPRLNDTEIELDSYIISNTDYKDISYWGTKAEFQKNHVLFAMEENYIDDIFELILADNES